MAKIYIIHIPIYVPMYFNFEMKNDPLVLAPHVFCLHFAVENFSQRIGLIRDMKTCRNKGKQRRPNKNNVVTEHSQGPLVPSQGP